MVSLLKTESFLISRHMAIHISSRISTGRRRSPGSVEDNGQWIIRDLFRTIETIPNRIKTIPIKITFIGPSFFYG